MDFGVNKSMEKKGLNWMSHNIRYDEIKVVYI